MTHYRVHDLLRIVADQVELPPEVPGWVGESLHRTPWVVVRRADTARGHIPVGVRGASRAHRHALTIPHIVVQRRVTPDDLSHSDIPRRAGVPALAALAELRTRLHGTHFRWGPTGSVGFELASGNPCVQQSSDLDIAAVIDPSALPTLGPLAAALRDLPVRVDCSLELPCGALALTEFLGEADELLLKTADGPRLVSRGDLPR